MKPLLAAVLLTPVLAFAAPVTIQVTVVCDNTRPLLDNLEKQYGERPLWIGKSDTTGVVLVANPETRGWTIVQYNEKVACVLTSGDGFRAVNLDPGKPL